MEKIIEIKRVKDLVLELVEGDGSEYERDDFDRKPGSESPLPRPFVGFEIRLGGEILDIIEPVNPTDSLYNAYKVADTAFRYRVNEEGTSAKAIPASEIGRRAYGETSEKEFKSLVANIDPDEIADTDYINLENGEILLEEGDRFGKSRFSAESRRAARLEEIRDRKAADFESRLYSNPYGVLNEVVEDYVSSLDLADFGDEGDIGDIAYDLASAITFYPGLPDGIEIEEVYEAADLELYEFIPIVADAIAAAFEETRK